MLSCSSKSCTLCRYGGVSDEKLLNATVKLCEPSASMCLVEHSWSYLQCIWHSRRVATHARTAGWRRWLCRPWAHPTNTTILTKGASACWGFVTGKTRTRRCLFWPSLQLAVGWARRDKAPTMPNCTCHSPSSALQLGECKSPRAPDATRALSFSQPPRRTGGVGFVEDSAVVEWVVSLARLLTTRESRGCISSELWQVLGRPWMPQARLLPCLKSGGGQRAYFGL